MFCLIKNPSQNILIDTSPDLRQQLLNNKIKKIDGFLFTYARSSNTWYQ